MGDTRQRQDSLDDQMADAPDVLKILNDARSATHRIVVALQMIEQGYYYRGSVRHELTVDDARDIARRTLRTVGFPTDADEYCSACEGRCNREH